MVTDLQHCRAQTGAMSRDQLFFDRHRRITREQRGKVTVRQPKDDRIIVCICGRVKLLKWKE